jgi:hypothetical protein
MLGNAYLIIAKSNTPQIIGSQIRIKVICEDAYYR